MPASTDASPRRPRRFGNNRPTRVARHAIFRSAEGGCVAVVDVRDFRHCVQGCQRLVTSSRPPQQSKNLFVPVSRYVTCSASMSRYVPCSAFRFFRMLLSDLVELMTLHVDRDPEHHHRRQDDEKRNTPFPKLQDRNVRMNVRQKDKRTKEHRKTFKDHPENEWYPLHICRNLHQNPDAVSAAPGKTWLV